MSDSKKSLERCALDVFLKNNRALRTYTVYEDERPDFRGVPSFFSMAKRAGSL